MKYSSEQLDNFSMCPSFCNQSNSTVTLCCTLIGTRRPFWCFAWNFWWNFDFAPFCRWCSSEDYFCQSLCDETDYTAWINYYVCLDAFKFEFRIEGFELFGRVTRDGCYIVVRIAIVVRVIDQIVELLVALCIVNKLFIIAFWAFVLIWLTFVCEGFDVWACDFFGFLHFPAKCPVMTVIMTPSLTTSISKANILVILGNSWITNNILARLLVVRVAIAALNFFDSINRLSTSIQFFIYYLSVYISMCIATSRTFVVETFSSNSSLWVSWSCIMSKNVSLIRIVSSSPTLHFSVCSIKCP